MGKHIHNPALKFENDEEERIFLKVMKENMDEYSVKGATGAVQKLLGDMLNGMLGEELKEHLGFDKYDRKGKVSENNNYKQWLVQVLCVKHTLSFPFKRILKEAHRVNTLGIRLWISGNGLSDVIHKLIHQFIQLTGQAKRFFVVFLRIDNLICVVCWKNIIIDMVFNTMSNILSHFLNETQKSQDSIRIGSWIRIFQQEGFQIIQLVVGHEAFNGIIDAEKEPDGFIFRIIQCTGDDIPDSSRFIKPSVERKIPFSLFRISGNRNDRRNIRQFHASSFCSRL